MAHEQQQSVRQRTADRSRVSHYAYIDAVRGYAILMVIAVHTSQLINDLPAPVRLLADQGARGVQLFFVASALTLCLSWQARQDGAGPFYVRRLFRIAPMFWLAIVWFVWRGGLGPYAADGSGFRHVAITALFVHGFMPDTIASVVPGGWSIAVEMMFYAILPPLMLIWSRLGLAGAALLVVGGIILFGLINRLATSYGLSLPPSEQLRWFNYIWLWYPTQAPCFLLGMLLARIADRRLAAWSAAALLCLSVAVMLILPFYEAEIRAAHVFPQTAYALTFAAFVLALMNWQPRIIVNPAIAWIGKISFSGYLVHLAIIPLFPLLAPFADPTLNFAVMMFAITSTTIAISSLTYLVIEKPMIRSGERLIVSWRGPAPEWPTTAAA